MKDIICYDVSTCPNGLSLDRVFSILKKNNVLLFSSKNTGHTTNNVGPYILNPSKNNKIKFIDTVTEYGKELLDGLRKL